MAFNAGDILARLKLDRKHFKAGIEKSKQGARSFKQQMFSVGTAIKALWAGTVIASVTLATKKIYAMAESGARLQDMERAFDRMATRAGISSKALVYDVKQITNALTNKQIRESANTLELLGVGMGNLPRLTRIARAAAVAMGKDVGYMLESIATGTARQSRLWLDNLGIIISVEEANKSYAAQLGKTVKALTDTEQRAAFLNAVLEKGDDIVNAVGTDSELAGEKVARLGVAFENLGDYINKVISRSQVFQWVLNTIVSDIARLERQVMLEDIVKNFEELNDIAKLSNAQIGRLFAEAFGSELEGARELSKIVGKGEAHAIMQEYIKLNRGMTDDERGLFNKRFEGRVKYMLDLLPAINGQMANMPTLQELALQNQQDINNELQKTVDITTGLGGFAPPVYPTQGEIAGPVQPLGAQIAATGAGALFPTDLAGPFELAVPAIQQTADAMREMSGVMLHMGQIGDTLGGAFGALFEDLAVGSDDAGRAFASNLLVGIAQVADNMGRMLVWSGLGIEALKGLHGAGAIIAGVGLMAIAGIMRGAASKNAPVPYSPDRAVAREQQTEEKGGATFIVQGDFMGEKYWIDVLAEKLYGAQRDRSVKLVWDGA